MARPIPAAHGGSPLQVASAKCKIAPRLVLGLVRQACDAVPREQDREAEPFRPAAKRYLAAMGLAAAATAVVALGAATRPSLENTALAVALMAATVLAWLFPLTFGAGTKLYLDTAVLVAAMLLFDPGIALVVVALGRILAHRLRRRRWDETWINTGIAVLQVGTGGALLSVLGWRAEDLLEGGLRPLLLASAVGAVVWLVNILVVAPYVALQSGNAVRGSWHALVAGAGRDVLLVDVAQIGIGVIVAEVAVAHRWLVALLLLPAGALYHALAYHVRLRRRAERRLEHQAFHDPLTDLPNRALFLDRLEQALAGARGQGDRVGLLFVDLDRFKFVNDSLGHAIGDQVLVLFGQRLRESVQPGDIVARFGGDEFTVLLERVSNPRTAEDVASRIVAALEAPFEVDGHESVVAASIGIALAIPGSTSASDLLRDADVALYRAKKQGAVRWAVFDADMDRDARQRVGLEIELRGAIARDELHLAFQPQVELATGRLVGAEALLRWHHPTQGILLPDAFVPLAEETGLILPIGRWVLEEACRCGRSWHDRYRTAPVVGVNLSARQFQDPGLVEAVSSALLMSGLEPSCLKLEITESAMMADAEERETLDRLKGFGVQIAIDDFGTGYSSLDYLRRFPVDELKIDRAFVAGLGRRGGDTTIVRAVVGLAHALGLTVVAEGIETEAQVRRLRELGCGLGQGHYFHRPLSADGISALLERSLATVNPPASSSPLDDGQERSGVRVTVTQPGRWPLQDSPRHRRG